MPGSPVDFLTVPALVGTRHGFLTRRGGVSSGLFASLNVGLGSSDDRAERLLFPGRMMRMMITTIAREEDPQRQISIANAKNFGIGWN